MRIRAEYYVGPKLRFLANLDMKRMMERSLRRASIPYDLSEGYNPQIKLSMGTVLPVGIWGEQEYLDIELREPMEPELFMQNLNKVLPEGIKINQCQVIDAQTPSLMKVINAASYAFLIEKGYLLEEIKDKLLDSPNLIVKSRGKKKDIDKNLRPGIYNIEVKAEHNFDIIKILVAVGEPVNVRYDELVDLLTLHGLDDNGLIDVFRVGNYVKLSKQIYTPLEKVN